MNSGGEGKSSRQPVNKDRMKVQDNSAARECKGEER
jgi:hypothetical protein